MVNLFLSIGGLKVGQQTLENKLVLCCLCCCSSINKVGIKNGYQIWMCPKCGFMTTYPLPSLQELRTVYTREYFLKQENEDTENRFGYKNVLSKGAIKGNENVSIIRLKIIENLVGQKGSVLDAGCAAGTFLSIALKRGWVTAGVELNPQMRTIAAQYCSEGNIWPLLEEARGKYSVITMWEYLEHVIDPVSEIKKVKELLKPNGLLCLSFPNLESRKSIKDKLIWEQVKPPEHLHYWMASNIKLFLEKLGFSIVGFRYRGFKPLLEGKRRFGSRSNPKTVFWPLMSIFSILTIPFYDTNVRKVNFPIFIRRMYEGIEVYAKLERN